APATVSQSSAGGGGTAGADNTGAGQGGNRGPIHPRLLAMMMAARYYGLELDPGDFRLGSDDTMPTAAALSSWAQTTGMWSRALRLRWRHLFTVTGAGPVVLLFNDGSAGLLVGSNPEAKIVFIRDPRAPEADPPVPVDELRLNEVWSGEAVLLRAERSQAEADPPFTLRWLISIVLKQGKHLRDLLIASVAISFLTIFPPLLVMQVVDRVLTHHSYSTLTLISLILATAVFYETLLGYARRLIILVIGVRIDAQLNLQVFNRMIRLPLDYFERHPAGETMYRVTQVHQVRQFITGKLMTTLLDMITLLVLLPFLFWLNATLAWIVLVCATAIMLIILAYLRPIRMIFAKVITAETLKNAALGETIFGIKTVKSLALEPQRKALWDEKVAEVGKWRFQMGRLSNWPQTLVTPIERFMWMGVILVGAYLALSDDSGYQVGGMFAFMMLSQRVSTPLVGLARLIEEWEEVAGSMGQAGEVLNRPLEMDAASGGLRPKFAGAVEFEDVTFTYAGTKLPALDRLGFAIPAGTMLGIVGRSGSGKSTITRLLQGINRDYSGYVKIDSADLREINLRHLRSSFGVVLQENFLFR
ncbi:MAG TPA: peptidase domain-containing ABC transporter, partial [Rhodopila sp.]